MSISVGGEHLLWNGRLTPKIGSGSRKKGDATMGWMHAPVSEVYGKWLALPTDWTAEQRETFIALWAERLEGEAGDLAMDIREESLRAWRAEHGQQPDLRRACASVRLRCRPRGNRWSANAFYDRIPLDEDGDAIPPEPVSGVPWNKRWMDHRYRVGESTDEIDEHARQVWPDHSTMFQVLAAELLTARLEEGRPVPKTRRDQLAHDLVPDINEMLCRMKRPPSSSPPHSGAPGSGSTVVVRRRRHLRPATGPADRRPRRHPASGAPRQRPQTRRAGAGAGGGVHAQHTTSVVGGSHDRDRRTRH